MFTRNALFSFFASLYTYSHHFLSFTIFFFLDLDSMSLKFSISFFYFFFWMHALKAKSKSTNIHTNTQAQNPLLIIVSIYILLFPYQNARFQCVLKWILCFLYMCVLCMCANRNKTISEYFLLYAKDTKLTPKSVRIQNHHTRLHDYTFSLFFLKN